MFITVDAFWLKLPFCPDSVDVGQAGSFAVKMIANFQTAS
jgi:hypothetical protein